MQGRWCLWVILPFIFSCVGMMAKEGCPTLISVDKVWDQAPHSAFTDLVRFKGKWYLTFREGADHVGVDYGQVRVLESKDGLKWKTVALFKKDQVDLRDPKFSMTPKDQLMINMAGTVYSEDWEYLSRTNLVTFSFDGNTWSHPHQIMEEHDWLWRVTWHEGKAYGVSYRAKKPLDQDGPWVTTLYQSDDGMHFEPIIRWNIPGHPSETTLRFTDNGEMVALVRRGFFAWIGTSKPPFDEWTWYETKEYVGGPNFLIFPDGSMWASGRFIDWERSTDEKYVAHTALAKMTKDHLEQKLVLPSEGDSSYPGMVYDEGFLWMSYYSSHEGRTAIYLAKILIEGGHF